MDSLLKVEHLTTVFDLASGGAMVLPDSVGSTAHSHLLIGCGKEGKIYLVDRDGMGHFNPNVDSQIVQSVASQIRNSFCTPAYFNNQIYYQSIGDNLKAFGITNGARDMDSTPPAMIRSESPALMARAAIPTASIPEPHRRFRVAPGTSTGSPASRVAIRETLRLSSPA